MIKRTTLRQKLISSSLIFFNEWRVVRPCLFRNAFFAATVLSAPVITGCRKDAPKAEKTETKATEFVDLKRASSEPPVVPALVAVPEGLAGKLEGYWVPHTEKMMAAFKDLISAKAESANIDPAAMAPSMAMLEATLSLMTIHIENGKSAVYSPKGTEEHDFKVLAFDEVTGEFVVESKSPSSGVTTLTYMLDGELLMTKKTKDKPALVLRRIDQAEFNKRKAMVVSRPVPATPPNIPAPAPAPAQLTR